MAAAKRLKFQNIPNIPDGYYDQMTKEELAWIKEQHPGSYEQMMVAVKEHEAAQKPQDEPAAGTAAGTGAQAKPAAAAKPAPSASATVAGGGGSTSTSASTDGGKK